MSLTATIIDIRLPINGNTSKLKHNTHSHAINVDQGIKFPYLRLLSFLLLAENKHWFEISFSHTM